MLSCLLCVLSSVVLSVFFVKWLIFVSLLMNVISVWMCVVLWLMIVGVRYVLIMSFIVFGFFGL